MRYSIPLLLFVLLPLTVLAQNERAAVMSIGSETVEMQRAGTEQWIPVSVEAIVGVGDVIRTDETGRATITFLDTGAETTLEPDTLYRIDSFTGQEEQFNISVSVLAGQTRQRLEQALDAGSSYDVNTPGATLAARGTEFRVRVEDSGRSAMLVSEGVVEASAEAETEEVLPEFGVRSEQGGDLSDVVRASTFAQLDAALDGCTVNITTPDDVRINVRLGPSTDFPRVGSIAPDAINIVKGTTPGADWYRIDFRGGFGWILASEAAIESTCAGLREFESGVAPEDPTAYEFLGDPIELDDLQGPQQETPGATEEAAIDSE